ncbi:MAG: bifunctional diaminohydroxyphosphoribosylaminopyrimidine deaminase/5-amino-6-(5-phosphoribosylamino)uracil reductase RibD [Deltaproteobacteria bacterium]|nr:bifunctional diaminohydroxyphosphoribosylaminopyrimidine deaminase/5-amino-6-(5-phosphoribosylamino)uracil reductase RibD [Deltaproteobacteria bacterium]
MRLALGQARRALGRTFPNPAVGAVVFRGGRVLGRGATRPPGGPHAEIVALAQAARRHGAAALRGASLAVTLEPCAHQGRTGPCTEALVRAGIARVYLGHRDPVRHGAGGGVRALRRAGVAVREGVLEAACREQHRGFLSVVERGRPWVTLKLAASLDGRIATARGESRWITGPAARAWVHRLRARSDAILVGSATALADDPELSARRAGRVVRRPLRVLVDSRLRVPPRARLFREHAERTWVLCSAAAPARRRRALEACGARVLALRPGRAGRPSLHAALARLGAEGIGTLLVEGGGVLAAALLRAGLADDLAWLLAPRLLGAEGRPALGPLGVARLAAAPRLGDARVRRIGPDLLVEARIGPEEAR